MSTHLAPKRLKVIRATAPAVAANIFKITPVFYDKMLGENPALYEFFNKSNQRNNRQPDAFGRAISPDDKDAGGQAATLSQSVLAAMAHLEHLEEIAGPAQRILHKHAALGVMPEHYQTLHDYFLKATAEVLGDAVTPEVADAWSGALLHVAEFFVKHETDLYDATTTKTGWDTRQAKEFTIFKVENASNCMKSIYFKPKDGKGLPAFTPGQYVTVKHNPTSAPHFAPRHYTLNLADSQSCVYFCMPPALLLKVRDAVEAAGVADKARCFYEPYGPGIV